MIEKREDERFDLSLGATLMVIPKSAAKKKKMHHLMTKNICMGGAFFPTSKCLPLGTKVKIQIVLPLHMLKTVKEKKALLQVEKGVVIRHESDGMAVAFEKGFEIVHQEPFSIH
jgi:hypothetical protein